MLQKLKEAGITAGLRSSNIRIVDPALIPTGPSRPNKSRNILLSIAGRVPWRYRPGASARVSRQYREDSGRHRNACAPAFAGRRSRTHQLQRKTPRPFFETLKDIGRNCQGRPRGADFAQHAAVANVRSVSRVAHVFAIVAGGSSASGHLDDQRAAPRGQNHRCGQPGGDACATGRQDACSWTPICANPVSIEP